MQTNLRQFRAWTLLCLVMLAACGGGTPASDLAKPPEYEPEDQASCKVRKSQEKPLIVEWPSAERTDLEAQTKSGSLVVVRYEGCEMRLLSRCKAPGAYAYTSVTPKSDTLVIRDADELYAAMPVGAIKLEGKLKKSGQLNVAMTMVGKFAADRAAVAKDELEGECEGATHIIVGLTVGAFEFYAGATGEAGAEVSVLGAGAGGKSKSSKETLTKDGDRKSCDAATDKDEAPPSGCGASLRLEVVELEAAKPEPKEPVATKVECPKGTKLVDNKCMPQISKTCPAGMHFVDGKGCEPTVKAKPPTTKVDIPGPTAKNPTRGPATAPVLIHWFGEYQDPFSKKVDPTITAIEKEYPGQIRVVWHNFPLAFHKEAKLASVAAMAVYDQRGAKAFWRMHALLLENQRNLGRSNLETLAKRAGADVRRLKRVLDKGTHSQLEADLKLGQSIKIRGVPTFVINGNLFSGAQPIDKFRTAVDKALRDKGIAPKKAAPAIAIGKSPTRGQKTAPVVIHWFGAFQEPFTRRVDPTIAQLEREFPGKILIVWRNMPLEFHQNARAAANAAMEAFKQGGNVKFWNMYRLLLNNPTKLEQSDLERYAKKLRLNMTQFKQALSTGAHNRQIDLDMRVAKQNGLRGTPSFLINGTQLSGAQPIDKFREAVRAAMAR